MTQDAEDRLAALRSRLFEIAAGLEVVGQRREAMAATADEKRSAARAHVAELRSRLFEAEAELDGLRIAMANRGVIERAKGMVMLRLACDEDTAFEYLRAASMRTNRRVADIAGEVVRTRAGELSRR